MKIVTFKFSANATRVDFGLKPPNVGRMFSNNFDAGLVRTVGHFWKSKNGLQI